MSRSLSVALLTFAAAGLAPALASAAPPSTRAPRTARVVKERACEGARVEVAAGSEVATLPLVDCGGKALAASVDHLSVLARPGSAPRPSERAVTAARASAGPNVAPGIRRIDAGLVERVSKVVEHFRKEGRVPRVELVSGYRPRSAGSFHSTGRALDLRIEGVKNEEVVAFCKTLPDTGCGYYPNSSFVHIDARERGAGHVSWIDTSRPGEPPHYVTAWPPPGDGEGAAAAPALSLPALPP